MIDREIAAIAGENLEQLRARWSGRWGDPPRLRSVALLRSLIAWRLQAEVHGGIDAGTRRMLRGAAAGPEKLMAPGTVLTREWKGVRYQVEITEDGFIHAGKRWKSLSEVARAITGTRWNGPRFFGLREAV